ncbi:uncharacterized protein LOC109703496 isoform X1 [Ananas comosus]|uniref:Uncharacterized protein LOC109703496 isoform X1 n=1 Tax=Ananas comosus TaxID=4615 RepID=A0A6P5E966_ANACO|nr:uncharacterized protein LOC109703496 isoform X1 [Ananas comosus]
MDSDFAEVLVCNGNKPSVEFGSEEVVDKEEDEEETNMLLRTTVNGGIVEGKGPKSSRRKVQWNDLNGNKLVEVLEFQPSDSSDSEEDFGDGSSIWEHAIFGWAQLCCCLGGRRLKGDQGSTYGQRMLWT